jgi:hypothetical protein
MIAPRSKAAFGQYGNPLKRSSNMRISSISNASSRQAESQSTSLDVMQVQEIDNQQLPMFWVQYDGFKSSNPPRISFSYLLILCLGLLVCQSNALAITSSGKPTQTHILSERQAAPSTTSTIATDPESSFPSGLPQPFDTSLGNNFTAPGCPTFFKTFLGDKDFQTCYPFSLLLQVRSTLILPTLLQL